MIWVAVLGGSLLAYLTKFAGYVLPARAIEHPRVRRVTGFIPIAMLAALVAVQTLATGSSVTVDARLAGLSAAVVALLLRAPFLVVVIAAAATAAILRVTGVLA